jgi:hypothetical protein
MYALEIDVTRSTRSARQNERQRDRVLFDLVRDYDRKSPGHLDATQQVDDLAFDSPELFWKFLEAVVASDIPLSDLGDIGWGPLTWLLRRHPDGWAERVAGFARRDNRMRSLIDGVDQDRIAPDVWRRLEAAMRSPSRPD